MTALARIATLLFCIQFIFISTTFASSLPFNAGEKLTYALKWEAIPAGTASIEVLPEAVIDGKPMHHFRMTARTNSFADVFYKVRDQVDSYADMDLSRSTHYRQKQREGSYKRDITVNFLWDRGQARYENTKNGPKDPILILPGTYDPLSVFYAFRSMELDEGASIDAPVTDGVKCVIGQARVVGRETIRVPAGEFDTWVVEPELRHIGGVFKKSPDASLRIWVTADEKKIPVMISSKVVVGRFFAVLNDIDHGAPVTVDNSRPRTDG
ncbi:hypothetical protein GGQ74_001336 [Desulfobaculum xiamenense]|uniref:DUF3108 domain-containing protein n=1 Tax=Desulfobaculum xiamenense TaxID=995050 RepID=A0A846QFX2_9BACT|nr:hypothetical protein [Desulfobaculum xiamenense]